MLKINETVIVEGKYDKIKLDGIIEANIIVTNGFSIFKDKKKMALIKRLAEKNGIIILTDSDSAGAMIRSHLLGTIDKKFIKNVYLPKCFGKEKRKDKPSAEGLLGVEGISNQTIVDCFAKCGIIGAKQTENYAYTKLDLYNLGLVGAENSAEMRKKFLEKIDLPTSMSVNQMLSVLSKLFSPNELEKIISEL